jgi:hypothetical protein
LVGTKSEIVGRVIDVVAEPLGTPLPAPQRRNATAKWSVDDWLLAIDAAASESLIAWFAHQAQDPSLACPVVVQALAAGRAEPYLAWTRYSAALSAELIDGLATKGVWARVFKGQLLAQAVYGDFLLRNSSDIDLIVPVECIADTAEYLQSLGFQSSIAAHWFHDQHFLRLNKEVAFSALGGAFTIDLHWKLVNRWNPVAIAETELFEDEGCTVAILGKALPWFSAEKLFRIQLAHVISSDFAGLKAWVDLAHTSDLLSADDWRACLNRCQTLGSERALWVALLVLQSVFQRPVPLALDPAKLKGLRSIVDAVAAELITGQTTNSFWRGINIAAATGASKMAIFRALSQLWTPAMIDFENAKTPSSIALLSLSMLWRRVRSRVAKRSVHT